jgi:hypothetical protein
MNDEGLLSIVNDGSLTKMCNDRIAELEGA